MQQIRSEKLQGGSNMTGTDLYVNNNNNSMGKSVSVGDTLPHTVVAHTLCGQQGVCKCYGGDMIITTVLWY